MLKTVLIPAASARERTMMLSEDGKTFSYIHKRDGEFARHSLSFWAGFDLRQ